jgi:hypothetical protein
VRTRKPEKSSVTITSIDALPPSPGSDGRARRLAPVAEELDEQIGRAVDDARLIAEPRAAEFTKPAVHGTAGPVEIAESVLHRGERP